MHPSTFIICTSIVTVSWIILVFCWTYFLGNIFRAWKFSSIVFYKKTSVMLCCKTRIVKWGIWPYSSIFDCGSFLIKPYLSNCQSFTLLQLVYLKGAEFLLFYVFTVFYKSDYNTESSENVNNVLFETPFPFLLQKLHLDWQIKWHWDLLLWDGLN